ncbi:universal stress protein [Neolewinella lacunae]|uniref:Universal stress protein n=1 Tax=Neolewinella lacunae TaxID=1517758 RepID=A0A923PJS4_9BACT|nr:universal stress protein [Neolewinella lacunae]MBC6995423.1 universal stress protein [Neolewinella lacunae]MDN3633834.1 universal stress protein [Neolewinella lacunae]
MSSILIPVDFSYPCHNAFRFGLQLAQALKLEVVLAHYSLGSLNPGQPLVFTGDGSLRDSSLERLRDFAKSSGAEEADDAPGLEFPAGVTVHYETEYVFSVSASIIARASKPDIALVVMATRSSKKLLDKWLGSTSTTVSEACQRPVYLIPADVKYRPFQKIVVANNDTSAETYPLGQIEGLATTFQAEIHFVHVEWPDQFAPLRFVPWRLMEKLHREAPADGRYPYEVVTVENQDVTAGLLEYAATVDADLVVIVNRLRNRWRSLLAATLTQNLALRAERAVLVLHTEEGG